MRGLLDPAVKGEVDYAEASKDGSNILAQSMIGNTFGTRTFIPDLKDRDECYAVLQIYSCAGEDAKQILQEYIEYFGGGRRYWHIQ